MERCVNDFESNLEECLGGCVFPILVSMYVRIPGYLEEKKGLYYPLVMPILQIKHEIYRESFKNTS